jgi:hypothetical protein
MIQYEYKRVLQSYCSRKQRDRWHATDVCNPTTGKTCYRASQRSYLYGTSLLTLAISAGWRAPWMSCLFANTSNEAPTSLCSIKIQESIRKVQKTEISRIEYFPMNSPMNHREMGIFHSYCCIWTINRVKNSEWFCSVAAVRSSSVEHVSRESKLTHSDTHCHIVHKSHDNPIGYVFQVTN